MRRLHPAALETLIADAIMTISEDEQWATQHQTCLRKPVGCSVVMPDEDGHLIRVVRAVNGNTSPAHPCTNETGKCGCSHAEPRAILELVRKGFIAQTYAKPLILLVNFSSCDPCANLINDYKLIELSIYKTFAPHWPNGAARCGQISLDDLKADPERINRLIHDRTAH